MPYAEKQTFFPYIFDCSREVNKTFPNLSPGDACKNAMSSPTCAKWKWIKAEEMILSLQYTPSSLRKTLLKQEEDFVWTNYPKMTPNPKGEKLSVFKLWLVCF